MRRRKNPKTTTTARLMTAVTVAWLISTRTIPAQTPPTITSQPANVLAAAGGAATLSVGVSGTGPFTYQWYFNGGPANFVGIITTVAGNGTQVYSGDGGAATNTSLYFPTCVAVDVAGNIFIADQTDNRVRKVGTNGIITTVAGNGNQGYSGDGGAATNTSVYGPGGVALDAAGNLFIADVNNNRIRRVGTNGIITTVAGNGNWGYSGDGGAAAYASLNYPSCVALDTVGNLFIADYGNNRIRKVRTNGIITTVAGNGASGYSGDGGAATNTSLYNPSAVALDAAGDLFIADRLNNRIRKVGTNGIITTVAGNGASGYSGDGGAATNAQLFIPTGVAVDVAGNLFIADYDNNCIRKVGTNGIIITVAGNGAQGYSGDGGAATNAEFHYPYGVAVDRAGNLFIADYNNNRIRKVTASNLTLASGGASLVLSNLTVGNVGSYYVVVSSSYGSVTSSVAGLGFQPWFTGIAPANGGVSMGFIGAPSSNYVFYCATNLMPPVNWTPLSTNLTDTNGNLTVFDTNTIGVSSKFYRVSPP